MLWLFLSVSLFFHFTDLHPNKYIVVGSGISGCIVAHTLQQLGCDVTVLETGSKVIPEKDTAHAMPLEERLQQENQHSFFIGKNAEALGRQVHPNIAHQTPQRIGVTNRSKLLTPIVSENFFPVEASAYGGLGNAWGLGSYAFSPQELQQCGLDAQQIQDGYKHVASLIGISGDVHDDGSVYCHNNLFDVQASLPLNACMQSMMRIYEAKRRQCQNQGIHIGRSSLALLTQDLGVRKASKQYDDDFYTNTNNAAFRPNVMLDELQAQGKVKVLYNLQAHEIKEIEGQCHVSCYDLHAQQFIQLVADKVILCGGALSTARILQASLQIEQRLPVLCNAYSYIAATHYPFIGKISGTPFSSLAQLNAFIDKDGQHSHVAMASIYNYRALLNFRLIQQMPLAAKFGIQLTKYLQPSFVIAGLFHPANYEEQNFVQLSKTDLPHLGLHAHYSYSEKLEREFARNDNLMCSTLKQLKCLVLKKMRTPSGGSIHYAGTVPFTNVEAPINLLPNGKVEKMSHVFVGDASGFTFLPGKGLSLTIMANAYRVAKESVYSNA
ncbi:MAG: hypothetical protein RL660_975 [Bacteroidota bacterium]